MSVGVTKQRLDGRGLIVAILVSTGELFWACVISSTLSANRTNMRVRTEPGLDRTGQMQASHSQRPLTLSVHTKTADETGTVKMLKHNSPGEGKGKGKGRGRYEGFDEIICPALEAVQAFPKQPAQKHHRGSGLFPQRRNNERWMCVSTIKFIVSGFILKLAAQERHQPQIWQKRTSH